MSQKLTGYSTFKSSRSDPEGWNKEVDALKTKLEKKYGPGRFTASVGDFDPRVTWTYRPDKAPAEGEE